MENENKLQKKYNTILPHLSEKQKRIYLSAESEYLGYGGISKVSRISGISRVTITKGINDIKNNDIISINKSRKKGGGRKKQIEKYPNIWAEILKLIEPYTRGEPESPLLWTSKSLRKLSTELSKNGFKISHRLIGEVLKANGFRLQGNRKIDEGKSHPDRDSQFNYIYSKVIEFQKENQPVISVDSKKKELIGNYKNDGKEWLPKGKAKNVKVYDFPSEAEGRGLPYGVYDLTYNKGWVNVGIDHDTAEFAVQTIRNWWNKMGKEMYSDAENLLITADGGGSNGSRVRLWKKELQDFANDTGLKISVCHFPPGTSKWNKIEHRLFSYITKNWRGKPLESYEIMVNLIGSTKTDKGLEVKCELDNSLYEKGRKVTNKEIIGINIRRDVFHGEWNYIICPAVLKM
jgi:hypothetical protein